CELAEVQVSICNSVAQQLPEQGSGLRLLWRKTGGQRGLFHLYAGVHRIRAPYHEKLPTIV
ncbi:MAG: hypothetical protein QOF94_1121, partial [Acidobacteriaceae bacterium]